MEPQRNFIFAPATAVVQARMDAVLLKQRPPIWRETLRSILEFLGYISLADWAIERSYQLLDLLQRLFRKPARI